MRGALLAALLLGLAPAAAPAQQDGPIGPADFEALTSGRTLSFGLDGLPYGAEQYLPDRRVIWRPGDGACVAGEWFARGEAICFVYDAVDGVQCWRFARRGGRVHATSLAGDMDLEVSGTTERPLACPGPDFGV